MHVVLGRLTAACVAAHLAIQDGVYSMPYSAFVLDDCTEAAQLQILNEHGQSQQVSKQTGPLTATLLG